MNIFDIHVHIYPEKISVKAAESIGAFYDGVQTHGDGSLADCVRQMDEAGVRRFCAHSVALHPRNVAGINRFIRDAQAQFPDRITPFAALHPDMPDMQAAVDAIVDQGFRGVKIHPDMQRFAVDGDRAAPMMEAIADRLPLLIHCGDPRFDFDGPRRILNLRRRFPMLRLICAHFGGWSEWDAALELLPGENMLVDLSSTLYCWPPEQAVRAIRRFGAENVLFGTDYPMWSPKEELARFLRLDLRDGEREDILWNNAVRLLDCQV